jgi:hypothetical protein
MSGDFVYLNVPGLLARYSNPSTDWHRKVKALARTQLAFFVANGLVYPTLAALSGPIESAVVKFSDFTPEGQAFIKSQAVERWLAACDRKGTIDAYQDSSGLASRLSKFKRSNQKVN